MHHRMRNRSSVGRAGWLLAVLLVLGGLEPAGVWAQYFRFGKNKVQYGQQEWFYLQSRHFDVYYYQGGYDLADFTARAAEDAYLQISELFQHQISDRIPIIVYQSHNDFAVTNAVDLPAYAEGIGGVTELFKNRVAVPFVGDYRSYRQTLHHELVHAVLNDMFYGGTIQSIIQNNIQLRIPHWFNEGLAEYASEGWSSEADNWVRDAVLHDNLPPIAYLSGFASYQAGQSVWDYVAEQYGREKVGEVLQRLRLTRSVEGSFKHATGLSLEDLSERWQKSLKEIHYPEIAAREDIRDIARPIITRENAGFYNTSPALSPQGDRLAFITTRSGLFDVYIASANDGKLLKKLIEGQTSAEFESLRILSPGLTWSPDGRRLALAVKSGPSDAIAVVDVESGRTTHYRVPQIDQIVSVAWSPVDDRIAFTASMDAQSDIYVLDLQTRETINYTSDVFSDHEPAWSPDGSALVFHSDRGSYTVPGRYTTEHIRIADHDYGQFDLYRLTLATGRLERLTFDEVWDERSPRYGADPDRLLFISDRNGIDNLYEKDLTTGRERPLTDVIVGLSQVSLSADGKKAALVALEEGTPTIYLMKTPFERRLDRDVLAPSVWAQRVMQETVQPAPALALAPASLRQANPFLRDAADGVAYAYNRPPRRHSEMLASRTPLLFDPDEEPALAALAARLRGDPVPDPGAPAADTTTHGSLRVDFRNYVFSDAFEEAAVDDPEEDDFLHRFDPRDHLDADGRYREKKYKLNFSPDIVYGTAGYDMLYGVQGVTQMMFSDILGNHQIYVATNLLIDLRNSDYLIAYNYLPRRVDWSFAGHHVSRLLPDYTVETYYRYRQYGLSLGASYPLDKFRRVDLEMAMIGISRADIGDPARPATTHRLLYPSVTFTRDVTTPGFLYPAGGSRFAVSLAGSPVGFDGRRVQFISLLADARTYFTFGRARYGFAFRASGGTSWGPGQQLFYTAGVQNWINRRFDEANGFPITEAEDFGLALPILPLRGTAINSRNGSHFGLINAEFRFPLIAALLPGPLPVVPLYNLQGTAFLDAGSIWGGRGDDPRFNLLRTQPRHTPGDDATGEPETERVLDDLIVGAGFGLRTLLLGYPVRLDFAWPFDGHRFGQRQMYLSIGLDF